ncbi:OpgC domain-containing protein [Alteromonas sp. P256]|uniref:OpgC domain-containing protein n=1 Tax=Alteromonas sp. P256 TaxID=3117399 RepID=UPI002FE02E6D
MDRDNRIDLIRGYAIFTICINHITVMLTKIGDVGIKIPTLTHYGYSSAAEIFFFMSGYMVGLVYLGKADSNKKIVSRALHLYKVNFLLLAVLFASAVIFNSARLFELTQLDMLRENFLASLLRFAAFTYVPKFTDLLFLYVALLLSTTVLVRVLNRSETLFLLFITITYALSQCFPSFKLVNLATNDAKWGLNILAYQFPFMLGLIAGKNKYLSYLFQKIDKNLVIGCGFCVFALIGAYVVKRYDLLAVKGEWWVNKNSLGPLRMLHFFIALMSIMCFLSVFRKFADAYVFRLIALVGRQSLGAFVASMVCCYISLGIWMHFRNSSLAYYLLAIVSSAAVIGVAWLLERIKNKDDMVKVSPVIEKC